MFLDKFSNVCVKCDSQEKEKQILIFEKAIFLIVCVKCMNLKHMMEHVYYAYECYVYLNEPRKKISQYIISSGYFFLSYFRYIMKKSHKKYNILPI